MIEEHKKKISLATSGNKNPNWKGGKQPLICNICGKTYFVLRKYLKKSKYCSYTCLGKSKVGKTFISAEGSQVLRDKMLGDKNIAKRPEVREKLVLNVRNNSLEHNPNWKGGLSFIKYPFGWQSKLKWRIRKRDNYTCQICSTPQEELVVRLHVHHIDYDKNNLEEENLVSLCNSCHTKTNFNREFYRILLSGLVRRFMYKEGVCQ